MPHNRLPPPSQAYEYHGHALYEYRPPSTNRADAPLLKQVVRCCPSRERKVAWQDIARRLGGSEVEGHGPLKGHHHPHNEDHGPELVEDLARLLGEGLWRTRAGGVIYTGGGITARENNKYAASGKIMTTLMLYARAQRLMPGITLLLLCRCCCCWPCFYTAHKNISPTTAEITHFCA